MTVVMVKDCPEKRVHCDSCWARLHVAAHRVAPGIYLCGYCLNTPTGRDLVARHEGAPKA